MELQLNQLYNMDCLEGMKQIPDKFFELAIVDPPYGLNIIAKSGKVGATGAKKYEYKTWDSAIPNREYFQELFRVSKNQIIWGGNYFTEHLPPSSCWVIWDKLQRDFSFADGEMAWCSFSTAVRFCGIGRGVTVADGKIHPTQKPVTLYRWLLDKYAKAGDKILDTHVGSGSSIIACNDMGFEYMGFELDTDYYEAALKRINLEKSQLKLFA